MEEWHQKNKDICIASVILEALTYHNNYKEFPDLPGAFPDLPGGQIKFLEEPLYKQARDYILLLLQEGTAIDSRCIGSLFVLIC
jgi:hypothetical protein